MFLRKVSSVLDWFSKMALSAVSYGSVTVMLLILKGILSLFGADIIPMWLVISSLVLTSWVMFPILYPFKRWIRNVKPFWYYFDDEDEFGFNLDWWMSGRKKNFWTAYKWAAIRNPMWNLQASLIPKKGLKHIISVKGRLTKNGEAVNPLNFATLKFVDMYGNYMDNKGDFLSYRYSTLGEVTVWYEIGDKLYFRHSYAKKNKNRWLELHIGVTEDRYTFRRKAHKKSLKVFEEIV